MIETSTPSPLAAIRRVLMATAVLAVAATSVLAKPSPAQATDTFRFTPTSLYVQDYQDPAPEPSDEISLRYGGVDFPTT